MGQLNYLNQHDKSKSPPKQNASAPDSIVHTPPIVHYFLGMIGILFGFSANLWQVFTTDPGINPINDAIRGKVQLCEYGVEIGRCRYHCLCYAVWSHDHGLAHRYHLEAQERLCRFLFSRQGRCLKATG